MGTRIKIVKLLENPFFDSFSNFDVLPRPHGFLLTKILWRKFNSNKKESIIIDSFFAIIRDF